MAVTPGRTEGIAADRLEVDEAGLLGRQDRVRVEPARRAGLAPAVGARAEPAEGLEAVDRDVTVGPLEADRARPPVGVDPERGGEVVAAKVARGHDRVILRAACAVSARLRTEGVQGVAAAVPRRRGAGDGPPAPAGRPWRLERGAIARPGPGARCRHSSLVTDRAGARNTGLVARRELLIRLRSRAYVLSTLLLVGVAAVVATVPFVIRLVERETVTRVAVVAPDAALAEIARDSLDLVLNGTGRIDPTSDGPFEVSVEPDEATARAAVDDGRLSGALVVRRGADGTLSFVYLTNSPQGRTAILVRLGAVAIAVGDMVGRAQGLIGDFEVVPVDPSAADRRASRTRRARRSWPTCSSSCCSSSRSPTACGWRRASWRRSRPG